MVDVDAGSGGPQPGRRWLGRPPGGRGALVAVGVVIGLWTLVMYRLGALRHDRFATFGFDLGIYDQAGWLVANGEHPFMTVRGLDVWGHHGTFVFYLLSPGYWIAGTGAKWLLIAQLASQATGAFALALLVRDTMQSRWRGFALAAAALLLLNPTNQFLVWEYFHPETFAIGPLLLAWWALRTERWWWFAAAAFVAATCKEDIVLAVAMMGVVIAITPPRTAQHLRIGVGTTLVAIGWYLLVTKWMIPARNPYGSFYEQQFFTDFGTSTGAVIWDVLVHPMHALRFFTETQIVAPGARVPDTGHLEWYRMMLVPTLGIGLLRPRVWIVAAPAIAVALLTDEGHKWVRDYHFHYSAVVAVVSVVAAVETVIWLRSRVAQARVTWSRGVLEYLPHATMAIALVAAYLSTRAWGAFPEPLAMRLALTTVVVVAAIVAVQAVSVSIDSKARPLAIAAAVVVAAALIVPVLGGWIDKSLPEARNPGSRGKGWWPVLQHETLWDVLVTGVDASADPRVAVRERAVALIPSRAPVSAAYNVTAHLSSRRFVYQFPNPWVPENWGVQNEDQHDPGAVEYLMIDRGLIDTAAIRTVVDHLLSEEFEVLIDEHDIVLARRVHPPSCIPDPSRVLRAAINDQFYDTTTRTPSGEVCPTTRS